MAGPLAGVTVLDLTHLIVGPYATKLLADYGADVIKVERPGGDPARALTPFLGGKPHAERSGTFFYLNTNKRSIVLDLQNTGAREVIGRLLERADLVVESFRPGVLDALGLGWDYVRTRKPGLPLVSISNFGQDGPYRDYKGSEVVLYGLGGELYSLGRADRQPVKMYGTAALFQAGAAASTALAGAFLGSKLQGIGQHVDFAIVEALLSSPDRRHAFTIASEFSGKVNTRRGAGTVRSVADGVYPCSDGFVEFAAASRWMVRVASMLGNPPWMRDPKWFAPGANLLPELVEEFDVHFYQWLADRTRREVWGEARRARVTCGPLFSVADCLSDPHLRERGFWERASHAELGEFDLPGRPFIMNATPWELRRPAPLLGEHSREILAEAGYSEGEVRALEGAGVLGGPE